MDLGVPILVVVSVVCFEPILLSNQDFPLKHGKMYSVFSGGPQVLEYQPSGGRIPNVPKNSKTGGLQVVQYEPAKRTPTPPNSSKRKSSSVVATGTDAASKGSSKKTKKNNQAKELEQAKEPEQPVRRTPIYLGDRISRLSRAQLDKLEALLLEFEESYPQDDSEELFDVGMCISVHKASE